MQLSKQHQMILLDSKDAGIVKASIPGVIDVGDRIAVPHTTKNARTLTKLGKTTPSPIYYFYNWPNGKGYTPYKAQVETAAFLTQNRNAFVLNEIGTGKTNAALWAADYMLQHKDINKVLIVSPLSTLNRVWADSIWMDFPHRKAVVLYGSKAKRLELLKKEADFYIINPDGLKVIWEEILERTDIDHIIVDEVAEYKEARTDKYKVLERLLNKRSIWGLTGTPTPDAPTDAWAQIKLIAPQNVAPYFNRFRAETMLQVTNFKWVARSDAHEKVQAAMQPAIRFRTVDCLDLPPATFIDLEVELSTEQTKAYNEMKKSLYTEYMHGEITAANEGVKMSKLIQIAGGVVYDSQGNSHFLNAKKRLDAVVDIIKQAGQKVIVFVPFTDMEKMVAAHLQKHWTVGIVDGSVSSKARDGIFSDFQNRPDPHVLVAHPKCMAHGLTLTEASTIIWYAAYPNTSVVTQANGRIRRGGQVHNQLYVHLQGSDIERRVYDKIRNNESAQGSLLNLFNS